MRSHVAPVPRVTRLRPVAPALEFSHLSIAARAPVGSHLSRGYFISGSGSSNNTSLKVLEAYTRDVGRGIARIDYDTMDSLAVSTGDVVMLP